MAISEAQRQEIIDLTGSMSVRDIAEHVGVSKDAVYRVQKTMRGGPEAVAPSVAESVALSTAPPAHTRTRDKTETVATVAESVAVRYDTPLHLIGRNAIASTMTAQLVSEMDLYERAKAKADTDPQAKWEMVQHQKLVQSALRELAKWCGLDKGTMPGADDTIENVSKQDVESMSLDDMLRIAREL